MLLCYLFKASTFLTYPKKKKKGFKRCLALIEKEDKMLEKKIQCYGLFHLIELVVIVPPPLPLFSSQFSWFLYCFSG